MFFMKHHEGAESFRDAHKSNILFTFLSSGNVDVKIFFVLSGYVLSLGYFKRGDNT